MPFANCCTQKELLFAQTKNELAAAGSYAERLDMAVDMLMASGQFPSRADVVTAANAFISMLKMAEKYKPSCMYPGDIELVRAKASTLETDLQDKDYELHKVSEGGQLEVCRYVFLHLHMVRVGSMKAVSVFLLPIQKCKHFCGLIAALG